MAGFFRRLVRELRSAKDRIFSNPQSGFLYHVGGGGDALSGVKVDAQTSMSLSAVFACVQAISYDVAAFPLPVYRKIPSGGKLQVDDHHVAKVLRSPNRSMIEFDCRSAVMVGALLYGNGYAELVRNNYGQVKEIWPIEPWRVMTYLNREGDIAYSIDGVPIPATDVLHIRGLTTNGLVGLLTTHMAKEAIGLGLCAQRWAAKFYANGARPGGHLKLPAGKVMPPKAKEELRAQWEAVHGGVENSSKVSILDDGLEWESEAIDPEQSQLLQSRQFSVVEIARYFNVNPIQIGEMGRATWSNLEESNSAYFQRTLTPWCRKIEQTVKKLFFLPSETDYFVEHRMDVLLRAKTLERYQAYSLAITAGWLLRSDVREIENLPDVPGLDQPVIQGAMVPGTHPAADPLLPKSEPPSPLEQKPTPPAEDEEKKVRSLLACQSPILVNEVRRLLRVESDKVLRAIKRGDFSSWVSTFYPSHRSFVSSSFEPVIRAMANTVGVNGGEDLLANAVERHLQESRSDLADEDGMSQRVECWDARADSFAASVIDDVVNSWKAKVK